MNTIKSYKDLLKEEERIKTEVELSKAYIDANIKSYLNPENLFIFLESKIEKEVNKNFTGEFELKKYLIGLSLDFVYNKLSDKLFTSSTEKDGKVDLKLIAKTYVDQFYINNKVAVTDIISEFIDKNINKLKK